MRMIWQWRDRECHPHASWRTIGDGSRPSCWWLQRQYREIELGSQEYLDTTDSRDIRNDKRTG